MSVSNTHRPLSPARRHFLGVVRRVGRKVVGYRSPRIHSLAVELESQIRWRWRSRWRSLLPRSNARPDFAGRGTD